RYVTSYSPVATSCRFFFFQAEDGIRDRNVTGVQTCALPILNNIDSTNILHQQEKSFVQEAEVDGIEILVNMAKQGKIDPWNVDIVEVTDKYLMHLFQSKAQNLRLTGRTLLFAAILLKLKSNVLEGIDVLDFEPQHQDEFNYDDE